MVKNKRKGICYADAIIRLLFNVTVEKNGGNKEGICRFGSAGFCGYVTFFS